MDIDQLETKMNSSLSHFNKEINGLRTGRASSSLVESILVGDKNFPQQSI